MYTSTRNLMIASAIALAITGTGGVFAATTVTQDITDARQETQIWTTYALSPYLRANDIKVSVHNGKAVLTGKVEEDVNKELAKEIALGVNGIKEVDNQILVEADYKPAKSSADRTYGEAIDDANISTAVKSKLAWSKYTDGLSVKVETRSGKVTLRGSVDTKTVKNIAGSLAMNTRGVVSVDNQLVLNAEKPATKAESVKNSVKEANQEISDSWITTKVKTTFLYSSNVSGSSIEVNTDKGVVKLEGKLGSGAERALAIELAQNVRGVKSVNAQGLKF